MIKEKKIYTTALSIEAESDKPFDARERRALMVVLARILSVMGARVETDTLWKDMEGTDSTDDELKKNRRIGEILDKFTLRFNTKEVPKDDVDGKELEEEEESMVDESKNWPRPPVESLDEWVEAFYKQNEIEAEVFSVKTKELENVHYFPRLREQGEKTLLVFTDDAGMAVSSRNELLHHLQGINSEVRNIVCEDNLAGLSIFWGMFTDDRRKNYPNPIVYLAGPEVVVFILHKDFKKPMEIRALDDSSWTAIKTGPITFAAPPTLKELADKYGSEVNRPASITDRTTGKD